MDASTWTGNTLSRPSSRQISVCILTSWLTEGRLISMAYGRPSIVAGWLSDAVPLPSMIDDDLLDLTAEPGAVRPDGTLMLHTFFVKTLELSSVANEFLLKLYLAPRKGGATAMSDSLASALHYDEKLEQWAESIPPRFSYTALPMEDDFTGRRLIVMLQLRHLHTRILLHRPALVASCSLRASSHHLDVCASAKQTAVANLTQHCASLCFEAADQIIGIVYANLDHHTMTGPLPPWWFVVLCSSPNHYSYSKHVNIV